jgi:hypothetical protein
VRCEKRLKGLESSFVYLTIRFEILHRLAAAAEIVLYAGMRMSESGLAASDKNGMDAQMVAEGAQ